MNIRCLIVDDEPSSQAVLKHFIADINYLEVMGTCNSAMEADAFLNANSNIDLLFLDINMPRLSGLSFYKTLQNPPKVIFTTAYSEYAVEGFEVNAIDYLLKPFSFERFLAAVNKVRASLCTQIDSRTILIKSNKVLHKVALEDIIYIEAFGDYVKVHLRDDTILTNSTFTNMLAQLNSDKFVRLHKSFAINMDKLKSIKGNTAEVLEHSIPIGQAYKAKFLERITKN